MLHSDLPPPGGGHGGVRHQVARLSEALAARGHQVVALVVVPEHARVSFAVRPAPLSAWCARGRVARLALTPVAFAIGRYADFDVVHAHGDSQLLYRRSTPIVRTFYGSARGERRYAEGAAHRAIERYHAVGERIARRLADRTVGISRATSDGIGALDELIPCGVDAKLFRPGPKHERPTIVFVGTMGGRKRGHLVVAAFREVILPRIPEARLVLIAADAEAEPGVEAIRRASDAEVADQIRSAWVLTLPSSYEGFGVPYIEAMASGTAVLATPNAGARELIEDGREGVLVDEAELGRSLCSLLLDHERRSELAARGLAASERFGWDRIAREYERVYREALSAPERRMPVPWGAP
ncbi:MAG: glycosyltransferase family 4 protein [Solirubrobacteraceae bacterium]